VIILSYGVNSLKAFNWEWRPAIVVGARAWAVLADGEDWTEVNFAEVLERGRPIPVLKHYFPDAPPFLKLQH
jgi:hypothetical protein